MPDTSDPTPAAFPSYTSGTSTTPMLGDTIGANLERTVATFPEREVLVSCSQGLRYTYREFNDAVDEVARGLLGIGIDAGDRVGIWAPNCAEWMLVQYATAKIGSILVNINPAYRTHELAYVVRQSGLRLLVAAESFKTSDYGAWSAKCPATAPASNARSSSTRRTGPSCCPQAAK